MTLVDTVVSGNEAEYWAGISNRGVMNILRSTITGNIADRFGGGVDVGGVVTIIDSTISGNVAPEGGAGIYNVRSLLTIRNTTIADNQGTGVHTSGWTEIIDSTIARNQGNQAGGFYVYGGTLRVTNSTISGNISETLGGGINIVEFVNPPDPPDVVVDLTSSTITNNVAKGTGGGGGLRIIATPDGSARAVMRSCIVSGNRSNGPRRRHTRNRDFDWLQLHRQGRGQFRLGGKGQCRHFASPAKPTTGAARRLRRQDLDSRSAGRQSCHQERRPRSQGLP
jgi:hypothetical protein